MLAVSNLHFDYAERPLLKGVHFTLTGGQLLHVKGANGVGKTTLLKLLVGLLRPTQGEICYGGTSIMEDLASYQLNVCYVGHKNGISQLLSARENCRFETTRTSTIMFDELVHRFGLQGYEDTPCGYLSLGQKRRVGLMRLLLSQAPLWILDEPLSALDVDGVELLMSCILNHLAQKGCVILTSHQNLSPTSEDFLEYYL